jgi:phage replication O-like protein O
MNGHTNIENSYLEWLTSRAELTSLDLRILLFIFRKTIGWKKEIDRISFGQLKNSTKCGHSSVIESVNRLEKKGYIRVIRQGRGKINSYQLVGYTVTTSPLHPTGTSRAEHTHKRNKETIQKDILNFQIEKQNYDDISKSEGYIKARQMRYKLVNQLSIK